MNGRALVQKSADVWNSGDRDAFLACYSDDCVIVTPTGTEKGQAAAAAFWDLQMTSFPGGKVTVGVLIESGDTVAEESVFAGTNTGPSAAPDGTEIPPTGRDMALPFAALHTVRGDRIISSRFYWDAFTAMAQLGLLPG